MSPSASKLRAQIAKIAPGTSLRAGLDRIVNGRTGALIVLGENETLTPLITGGFELSVPLTPTTLRELAKMDGALVVSSDLQTITHANVQLMPDAAVPTSETGTRHRTAERVSRQTGLPVISVSAAMGTISIFIEGERHQIHRSEHLLARANQGINAISGFRVLLREAVDKLSALEVQDQVTLRDLALVAQRYEMTNRLADEVASYVVQLGADGRLVALQLRELTNDLTTLGSLLQRDYERPGDEHLLLAGLHSFDDEELFDVVMVGRALAQGGDLHLDSPIRARGIRQLMSIPRLPSHVAADLIAHFGGLTELFGASTAELRSVEGVDEGLARVVREGLVRLAESAFDK